MKSFLKRLSKRLFSLVLCAVMVAGTFLGVGPVVSFEAEAANGTTIGDFTQTRIVENYESVYRDYEKRFFKGEGSNWATDFIIPGLSKDDYYTPQGMTYWKAKEWILISAYDARPSNPGPSVIYALDITTTNLVAVFKLKNVGGGSYNTGHGGGIAASEYNFYYADSGSKISYIPLEMMEAAYNSSSNGVAEVTLQGSVDFSEEMTGRAVGNTVAVKTSYCCYDEGVLWTGNFYYSGDDNYKQDFMGSAGYPSVLMGYRLRGYSSAQEWENLQKGTFTPATEKYKGCAGDPSYVIGFNFDKIQYAMVDNGKIYVSRSWSRYESSGHTRDLVIGDIDINSPGDANATIGGKERDCHLVNYIDCIHFGGNTTDQEYKNKDGYMDDMPFMGEALCVINNYLYMFTEGAAYAYYGEDGFDAEKNYCSEPIDVIWKIDQYAIQGLERPSEDVLAVKYQKVDSFDDINPDDEYIVLHESPIKDPVTQDNILYLLDSFGGYDYRKLPKKASSSNVSQASTGDSMGVVGYEIRDYDVKLDAQGNVESIVLSAEDDANKSIHWQFKELKNETSSGDGAVQADFELVNRDLYYADHKYFYSGDSLFAMTATPGSMVIKAWPNGDFNIFGNGGSHSLWCNDGSVESSITAYTNYYKSKTGTNYGGLDEVAGTFHINNSTLPAVSTDGGQMTFHIYKRISDPYASTQETNVYTDMKAHLQSDGTYNITVETYATNSLQYQRAEKKRPTDFIFVLDSSGLMDTEDCPEWEYHSSSSLTAPDIAGSNEIVKQAIDTGWENDQYYKHSDGKYYLIRINSTEPTKKDCDSSTHYQQMTIFYTDINNQNYYYNSDGTWTTTEAYIEISGSSTGDRQKVVVYTGAYYTIKNISRFDAVKKAVNSLVNEIYADASSSKLAHRIALVKFAQNNVNTNDGASEYTNTGMYTNDGTFRGYSSLNASNYQNAFFNTDQFGSVQTLVNGMPQELGHNFPSYGLDMASKIIDEQKLLGNTYDVNGNRSAVVIVISAGSPGYITESLNKANPGIATTTADDTLANGAYNLKRNGAHIYTTLFGNGSTSAGYDLNSDENFEKDFMRYLSSDYTGAKAMDDPGPLNERENADYYYEFSDGQSFQYDKIASDIVKNININSNVAISSLDGESILREHISDAFKFNLDENSPDKTTVEYKFEKSTYDGIGRRSFVSTTDKPTTVTCTFGEDNTLIVTGFDYSEYNVSEYNSNKNKGYKLIVTIKGVTADPSKTLTSAAINVQEDTALYESATRMTAGQPLKQFQQYYFAIPEYTYYMDYGIPMLDQDVNGTLVSVDSAPRKQSTYKPSWSTDNMGIKFTEDQQDLIYTLNSQGALTVDDSRGYVLIQRDDGTYDWFRLNIVPASTVYYEENRLKSLGGNYTAWDQNGSPDDFRQSLSSKDDVFGQDSVYIGRTDKFSLGTNKKVTVSESNNRSQTETFTFTGTGFDLYSACGNNTGIQTVTVRNESTNELVKVYMVDTYYNDSTYNTLYQVPIVQFKTDTLATYKVEVTAAYYSFAGGLKTNSADTLEIEGTDIEATSAVADIPSTDELFRQIGMDELIGQEVEVIWMDENSIFNGGTGAGNMDITLQGDLGTSTNEKKLDNYIDGFRIYNTDTYDNEYIESEKNASYYSVIDAITKGNMGGNSFAGYLEGGQEGTAFGDYLTSGGPKYEVYLKNNKSVAFRFKATNENVRAMISIRAASGTAKAKINGNEFTVNNSTETYFDITKYLGSKDADGCYTVTITNTGTGLLAVDNIKLTNAELSPLNGASIVTLNSLISMPSVEVDPFEKQPETFDFVQAPADNPFIDPEGSIPDIDEIGGTDGSTEEPVKNFFDIVVDFFRNVIERIKEVLQALPVFWTKAK